MHPDPASGVEKKAPGRALKDQLDPYSAMLVFQCVCVPDYRIPSVKPWLLTLKLSQGLFAHCQDDFHHAFH